MSRVLIVGAGFAGAVYARELAEAGYDVEVIDKRPHIAGNCYDYVHSSGVRIHHYGPHLFHTSNMRVVEWLNKFTEWVPYDHSVVARLPDGRLVPAPVNLDTVNAVFGVQLETPQDVADFLSTRVIARDPVQSAEDHLYSKIGPDLTDLFFRPYTQKMWELDLSEVDASVVQRLQIRTDRENRYFPSDTFQAMPKEGYTKIFEGIFDHPKISVRLNTEFTTEMLGAYDACFNSMPIDEYFGFEFGELPYRSIRFHLSEMPKAEASDHVVINYTDTSPYTRETWWHLIPAHLVSDTGTVLRTVEEPCNYKDNNLERYYPVKTSDGRFEKIYKLYQEKAAENDRLVFIGRCGTYQYLDMHQVINQSLTHVGKWIEEHR